MKKMIVVMLLVLVLAFTACTPQNIDIGFIGDLSSKNSQLAIDARNAIQLGVDEWNADGGLNGKSINLVVKDDQGSSDVAMEKHQEFKDENVSFVLGHLTSNMSDAMLSSVSDELLFLSPSISSLVLSEKDDNILRTSPILSNQSALISAYFKKMDVRNVVIVYDTDNAAYTEAMVTSFEDLYANESYKIVKMIPFSSREKTLDQVVEEIVITGSPELFIVAQAMDTAYIMQELQVKAYEVNAYSVSWSMTNDLIQNGGDAVEEMIFIGVYVPDELPQRYLSFKERFKEKYNYEPSFISVLAYDALIALKVGMMETEDLSPEGVKNALINKGEILGLQEEFSIDQYGDNNRKHLLYRLVNGRFEPMRDWGDQ